MMRMILSQIGMELPSGETRYRAFSEQLSAETAREAKAKHLARVIPIMQGLYPDGKLRVRQIVYNVKKDTGDQTPFFIQHPERDRT